MGSRHERRRDPPTTVTIVVSNFYLQLGASTGLGIGYESVAKLQEPLGSRTVIDGKDGHAVERATCPSAVIFGTCP